MRVPTLFLLTAAWLTGTLALPGPNPATPSADPSTCPLIKCASSTRPVYHPETKSCSCDPVPLECPNVVFCAAGANTVLDPSTKTCICEVTNAIPETCPQFKCLENNHVVYNPETDKCACTPDCPDLMCISEKRATYNSTTNSCSCVYIPGLEPSAIRARADGTPPGSNPRPHESVPTSFPDPSDPIEPTPDKSSCPHTYCIIEKRPLYNTTTGECTCESADLFRPPPGRWTSGSPTDPPISPPISPPDTDAVREKP